MASLYSSSIMVSQVGLHFVQKYYDVLREHPAYLYQFYTSSSTMIRVDGESTVTASGVSQIHFLVQSLHCNEIELNTIKSIKSWSEGIIVLVSGWVKSDRFSGWRKFVQTFSLSHQDHKNIYIVTNDIFHFVREKHLSDVKEEEIKDHEGEYKVTMPKIPKMEPFGDGDKI
ncbi:putative G3BP-like protein [Bidens hawaiensis]|uniref:putative G3BP-like protein n=1 Tax=Bidens hawaiensis TaxID=980011 RepID=UPI00404906C6